jgi:hypothetical protein
VHHISHLIYKSLTQTPFLCASPPKKDRLPLYSSKKLSTQQETYALSHASLPYPTGKVNLCSRERRDRQDVLGPLDTHVLLTVIFRGHPWTEQYARSDLTYYAGRVYVYLIFMIIVMSIIFQMIL